MSVVGWTNIGELCTADPTAGEGQLGILRDAAIVAVDGRIAWIGPSSEFPDVDVSYDMSGSAVLPGFVDAHMHPVFAGDRADEFDARMSGTAYSAGTTWAPRNDVSSVTVRAAISERASSCTVRP